MDICLVLFDERLQSLLVVWQAAVETQTLLGLGQPLQQDVNRRVELLRLQPEDTHHQPGSHSEFTSPPVTVGGCTVRYLAQRLLQPRLLGHGQVAHGLPASAQLLHLHFDPGRVVVAALDQLPGRTLEGLDAHRPLPQLLLENLRRPTRTCSKKPDVMPLICSVLIIELKDFRISKFQLE